MCWRAPKDSAWKKQFTWAKLQYERVRKGACDQYWVVTLCIFRLSSPARSQRTHTHSHTRQSPSSCFFKQGSWLVTNNVTNIKVRESPARAGVAELSRRIWVRSRKCRSGDGEGGRERDGASSAAMSEIMSIQNGGYLNYEGEFWHDSPQVSRSRTTSLTVTTVMLGWAQILILIAKIISIYTAEIHQGKIIF